MKKKNIYIARITDTEGLYDHLCLKTGKLTCAFLLQGDISRSAYLIVPDYRETDRIEFNILFDDDFRKDTVIKGDDRFQFDFGPANNKAGLREIEILDVVNIIWRIRRGIRREDPDPYFV